MDHNSIPYTLPGLKITRTIVTPTKLIIHAAATRREICCPDCRQPSVSKHSSYIRKVQDVPVGSQMVELHIRTRRFYCSSPDCSRCTFAEQHLGIVPRRGRRTDRLSTNLTNIGLALGGEAGARLARRLHMPTSGDTLLRLLRQIVLPPMQTPTIIGIDDWAFRKGSSYGTIIVDLERRRPIDLLPSRNCETVRRWLENHPTVRIVARDRSGEYKEAITRGAPQAIQVADRWHLLHNLIQAVERYLTRKYASLKQIPPPEIEAAGAARPSSSMIKRRRYALNPEREAIHSLREQQRQEKYRAIKARREQGVYVSEIAREFNLSRQTVSRWLDSDSLPPDSRGRYKQISIIDKYESYLLERVAQGCTNQSQLWREIRDQGFTGDRTLVSKWIRQQRKTSATPISYKRSSLPRPKKLVWILLSGDEQHTPDDQIVWHQLQSVETLREARQLARQFMTMVRNRQHEKWRSWLESCASSSVKELCNFASGLRRDEAAVKAALSDPWSSGQVEGQINRLKFYKRQMYGRAKFDLLRLRVLFAM